MAQVVIEMTANEAQAWAGIQRLVRGTADLEGGLKKVGTASKEAAQAEKDLERAAAKVFEQTRTPMERYTADMKKLDELLKAGKIDMDTFGRASNQAAEALKRAGEAGKSAFGAEAANALKGYLMSLTGIGGALAAVHKVFEEMQRIRTEAASKAREAEIDEGSLAEVAGGDPAKFKRLLATSREISATKGMSRPQAAALTFALESAGAMEQKETFADLYGRGIVKDPQVLVRAAKTMVASMGEDQTGGMRETVSKGFAAGEFAPSYTVDLLPAAARAASAARQIKVRDTELLAATSIVTESMGSPEMAGTSMMALMKALDRMGSGQVEGDEAEGETVDEESKAVRKKHAGKLKFGGKDLLGRLRQIEGLGLEGGDLQKLFGRQEGLRAYRLLLLNSKRYQQAEGRIGEAGKEDLVGKILGMTELDPEMSAARLTRTTKTGAADAARPYGTETNIYDAVLNEYEKRTLTGKSGNWLPDTADVGLTRGYHAAFSWVPGHRRSAIQSAVYGGVLDENPELLRVAVENLGGPDAAFAGAAAQPRKKHYEEIMAQAAADLKQAAADLKGAARGGPTLGKPDEDK